MPDLTKNQMTTDALQQPDSALMDPAAWVTRHPVLTIWIGAFCVWVSFALIIRMWFVHRSASWFKRLSWSFILLLPIFGWMAYGAWFAVPDYHHSPAREGEINGA